MPIPLGAILFATDFNDDRDAASNEAIRRSLRFARENEREVMKYVREHATEMSEDVMRKHIDYVRQRIQRRRGRARHRAR